MERAAELNFLSTPSTTQRMTIVVALHMSGPGLDE
jgi:hypothetical protein